MNAIPAHTQVSLMTADAVRVAPRALAPAFIDAFVTRCVR
jgi:hypothetical protein